MSGSPPVDPAGAQPRRDHRCLARWSRHVVPKTPGKKMLIKMHDPARVSHLPVRQSVRHPSGVAGLEPHRNPESSGLRPSTSGLKSGHPCRGASYPTLHDELNDLCKDQMRHPLHHYGTGAWGDGAKAYICDRLDEVGAAEAAIFCPLHHPIFGEVAFF